MDAAFEAVIFIAAAQHPGDPGREPKGQDGVFRPHVLLVERHAVDAFVLRDAHPDVYGGDGDPHVPNDGRAHHGYKLREGLVIAIEPWFLKTTDEIFQDPKDGWTLRASDGSRGAHSEHTIAITENGPIVFTDRTNL